MKLTRAPESPQDTAFNVDGKSRKQKYTNPTAATPEEFSRKIVTLLASNAPTQFFEFAFPAREELLVHMLKIVPKDRRAEVFDDIDKDFDEMGRQVLESFSDIRGVLTSKGCIGEKSSSYTAE